MKTKLFLLIFFFVSLFQINAQTSTPIPIENLFNNSSDFNRNIETLQNLPYPIIFIHGLNSSDKTWTDMRSFMIDNYGLTYGGIFDVCLNYDGNNSSSNTDVYSTLGADIAFYSNISTIAIGDFYSVNFDINNLGQIYPFDNSNLDMLSNESAIVKQGFALKYIIQMVLQKTGKSKVILMGHSMGGLCAREYIQNPSVWTEPYVDHHIAKLITTGTPHGGYEGIVVNIPTQSPIDYRSEAYRDLRHDNGWSVSPGVYLYGGVESASNMTNNLLYPFYNFDVNCNGYINENIIGINNKLLPVNTVDFAYIIGICSSGCIASFIGDGVVRDYNADLNNFSNFSTTPYYKNKFYYFGTDAIQIHTILPKQIYENMQGLDEPNEYNLAYDVNFSNTYKGFITVQPSPGYAYDYDDYKFSVNSNSQVSVLINNTFSNPIYARIINSNNFQEGQELTVNSGSNTLTLNLSAGLYYLEIYTTATSTSYLYPYNFTLSSTLSNPDFNPADSLKIYPNPTSSKVFFDNSNEKFETATIINYLGQVVGETRFSTFEVNQEVDLSSFSKGVYLVKFTNNDKSITHKIIKE